MEKTVAFCLCIALCFSMISVPQTVRADELEPSETLESGGGIWKFIATEEDGIYYVQNVKDGTYLASSGGFLLSEEPYAIGVTLQSDGGYLLDFQTAANPNEKKRYLAVGSNYYFSIGEQHPKNMFLFEKRTEDGSVSYTSTSEIRDGKEYVLGMEHRTESGTFYALLSQTNGASGESARAYSEALTIAVTASETWEELTAAGVLWTFEQSEDAEGWYLKNVKAGKYLSDDGAESKPNIDLNDTPVAYTAELLQDGTFHFFNATDKPHLAVGSGYKYSLGERDYKSAALFEKVRIKEGFALRRSSEIQEGKEYVFAMAFRTDTASTAEGALLYALTDQKEGTGTSARILSHTIHIKDKAVLVLTSENDAALFGKPAVTVTVPEVKKAPQNAAVSIPYALEDEFAVTTTWSPQTAEFAVDQPYTASVAITAQGVHSFTEDSLPAQITLSNGTVAVLQENGAVLSEDKKTITVTHTFDAITDPRQTPDYEVPTLAMVNLGTKLGEIALPTGFTFEEDLNTVLDTEGSFTYHLTYTPEDLDNWKIVSNIPVTVTVGDTRQTPDITIPSFPIIKRGTKLGELSMPRGFAWEDGGDTVLDTVGTVNCSLVYTPEDTDKYKPVTAEVTLTVKDGVASFEAEGVLWKFEKAAEENGWYLKNVAAGTYLSDSGEAYDQANEKPSIALNDTPIQYVAAQNTDGTFSLRGGSDGKPYLAVGSGNRFSIGEKEQKAVLFEKVRDGNGLAYQKAQKITEGKEYIVAYAHRDNDATAGSATSLFAMTNQMYGTNRILSYAFSITDNKIDIVTDEQDTVCLQAPVIRIEEPKAGDAQKAAVVEIPYALENEYRTSTVWSPAAGTFATGTAYTASITVTALGAHSFDPAKLPERVYVAGGDAIALSGSNCHISDDHKTITVNLSFGALSQAAQITVADGIANGTVAVADTNVNVGSEVIVSVTPDTGYQLKALHIAAGDAEIMCTDAGNGTWKFTMPEKDVTINAEFVKIAYAITAAEMEEGVFDGLPESAGFEDTVEFGIVPKEGYQVKSLKITNLDTGKEMKAVEVDGRYIFTMPAAPVSIEASFYRGEFTVSIVPSAYGKAELSQQKAKGGVNIFVTLTPNTGYVLQKLTVRTADGMDIAVTRFDDTFCLFTMPGADVTVLPVFAQKKTENPDQGGSGNQQPETLKAPAVTSIKSKKTGAGVTVTWEAVSGAVSYEVYRTVSGKQVKAGSTTSTSYVDTAAVSGKENSYAVVAVAAGSGKSSVQGASKSVTLPANVKNLKVKAAKGSLTISFNKVSGAKKYLLYRSEKKNGSYKLVKTLGAKKTTYQDSKVKKGKNYYYKVVVMKGSAYSIPVKAAGKKAK